MPDPATTTQLVIPAYLSAIIGALFMLLVGIIGWVWNKTLSDLKGEISGLKKKIDLQSESITSHTVRIMGVEKSVEVNYTRTMEIVEGMKEFASDAKNLYRLEVQIATLKSEVSPVGQMKDDLNALHSAVRELKRQMAQP